MEHMKAYKPSTSKMCRDAPYPSSINSPLKVSRLQLRIEEGKNLTQSVAARNSYETLT